MFASSYTIPNSRLGWPSSTPPATLEQGQGLVCYAGFYDAGVLLSPQLQVSLARALLSWSGVTARITVL
jgi:hypothetical protein